MDSNVRELQSLYYSRHKKEIDWAIEKFAGNYKLKYNLEDTAMDLWINK